MSFASCCILSYNRPAFLRTAIETLHEHAGAPLELIVHDDGSTEEHLPWRLHEYVENGLISTLITNPPGWNQGQGTALNRMFSMAKGDPIIKLDQDLIFHEGWLARVNEILANNDAAGVREPRIGLLGLLHYHHEPVDSAKTKLGDHDGWSRHTHILGSGFALRREAWRRLGPFEEHSEAFAEDWAMQKKVTDSGRWACGLPPEDLCTNQGFGIGPSTVVVAEGTVATIHKEPVIHGR